MNIGLELASDRAAGMDGWVFDEESLEEFTATYSLDMKACDLDELLECLIDKYGLDKASITRT